VLNGSTILLSSKARIMSLPAPSFLPLPGPAIAYRRQEGRLPGIVWCGGFKSDMLGTKAEALARFAKERGQVFLRFDYSGHGESQGAFEQGTVSQWAGEALACFDQLTAGPQIVVGSSMGGWIALLLARALRQRGQSLRLKGMVLVAPAPDFTERLMWVNFPEAVKEQIMSKGEWTRPSPYDSSGYPITRALIEDGRNNLLMDDIIETGCPVHVLQGMKDEDVPWQHAEAMVRLMPRDPVQFTLIPDGDHRLSRDEDIARLMAAVDAFLIA
jgi:pimeloyl-ACP methyl ester carboxylesterase